MSGSRSLHTIEDWISKEQISFPLDSTADLNAAIDRLVFSLDDKVELLGFGEGLHGSEEILKLRNRLFHRLVERHGFRAIALESTFIKGRVTNEYVAGEGYDGYDHLIETGFGHGFGSLEMNRELVEWMRRYNKDSRNTTKLRFYGIDIPTEYYCVASPGRALRFVLSFLDSADEEKARKFRELIEPLLGADADWENTDALTDATKSVGLSPSANTLRLATEDLAVELRTHRPEYIAKTTEDRFAEALHYCHIARQTANFHAGVARKAEPGCLMAIRDALMADNLAYIADCERGRGKTLVFAHNAHLQRTRAVLPWYSWWPAGAHLHEMFGSRYVVIGSGLGVSEPNGIGEPEAHSLEARLNGPEQLASFIPTHRGARLAEAEAAQLPTRTGSKRNMSYVPFSAQSLAQFDWLAFVPNSHYHRGGLPLPETA